MPKIKEVDRRFYIDGPQHPQTPHQIATERTYRHAFRKAVEQAAQWPEPDKLAIAQAWTERRKAAEAGGQVRRNELIFHTPSKRRA